MKNKEDLLSYDEVRALFSYDALSGSLRWVFSLNPRGPVGAEAGYVYHSTRCKHYKSRYVKIHCESYSVHRIIWLWFYGEWPAKEIDHIDGNGLNNRIKNIRDVIHSENQKNLSIPINNTSGVIGVSWHKLNERWIANIKVKSKSIGLGSFVNKSDAIKARKKAEIEYGFHDNHGKMPRRDDLRTKIVTLRDVAKQH